MLASTMADAARVAKGAARVVAELANAPSRDGLLRAAILACRASPPRSPRPSSSEPPEPSPMPPSESPPVPPPESAPIKPPSAHVSPPKTPPTGTAVSTTQTDGQASLLTDAPKDAPLLTQMPDRRQEQYTVRERAVPESAASRVLGFASLGVGLAFGAVAESAKRAVGISIPVISPGGATPYSAFVSDANAERLAASLSRMRGSALKLGQMLSIQDERVIPPQILKALERVRQGADVMPQRQLARVLTSQYGGVDWKERLGVVQFDPTPIAAASIGQVHKAIILDPETGRDTEVVFKVQYPGVARSIHSDINNLKRLVTIGNMIPESFYIDDALAAAREELERECDYDIEADNQERYRTLVLNSPQLRNEFYVPKVYRKLCTKQILVSEFVSGVPVDRIVGDELKNKVAARLLRLTLAELFNLNFQQSDPNWANYLYDPETDCLNLIDFGAARAYDEKFLHNYLRLIQACATRDREAVIKRSVQLGFLTGDERKVMLDAHVQASFAVGEPFHSSNRGGYDFKNNDIPSRTAEFGKVMLQFRLTPPPKEAYSLHRRLSGAFLMSTRLGANIDAATMLEDCVAEIEAREQVSSA